MAFFRASITAWALAFAASGRLPLIFGAMAESCLVNLVDCRLNSLPQFWSGGSGAEILCSNKCQSLSRSSLFIVGRRESCRIVPLLRYLLEACLGRFEFGFGGNGSLMWVVGSASPDDWNGCVGLVCFLFFRRF